MPAFTNPQTSPFWRAHCCHCLGAIGELEFVMLGGQCERCARRFLAMAVDCLANPDGPVPEVRGEWWSAPDLYYGGLA